MEDIYDICCRVFASRIAVLGHGEITVRPAFRSERAMWARLPGTAAPVSMKDVPGRSLFGTVPRLEGGKNFTFPLRTDLDAAAFLSACDIHMMRRGLGAAFFPTAAIALADALVFDERWNDFAAIRPEFTKRGRCVIAGSRTEWRPTDGLLRLRDDAGSLQLSTREALEETMRFEDGDEGEAFDVTRCKMRWALRMLRERSRNGRTVASGSGEWRELLAVDGAALACAYVASHSEDPKRAEGAIRSYLGQYFKDQKKGGADVYVLWGSDDLPLAAAVVGSDGTHRVVSKPDDEPTVRQARDCEQLVEVLSGSVVGPQGG